MTPEQALGAAQSKLTPTVAVTQTPSPAPTDAYERYNADVMARGQGNFGGGDIRPKFNTQANRTKSGIAITQARTDALDPRARDLGVEGTWQEFSSPWAQEYKNAAIYKKGNSYAGYGTQTPEMEAADRARGDAAHERTMGIYDREAKARHETRMLQAGADGAGRYAEELRKEHAAMWPVALDTQRTANKGAIDKARVDQQDPYRVGMGKQAGAQADLFKAQGRERELAMDPGPAGVKYREGMAAMGGKGALNLGDWSKAYEVAQIDGDKETMGALKSMLQSYMQQRGGAQGGGLTPARAAQIAKDKGVSVEDVYADYNAHAQKKFAQGGAVGYAQGGAIQNPVQDPMQQVHPMVGEYRRYSMTAQQMGATPVSFEDFGALRQAADTQGHQVAPMQENFAGGGAVPEGGGVAGWLREKLMPETTARIRGDERARQIDQQTGMQRTVHTSPQPRPEVHSSDPETEALLRKYKGYAAGGAVDDPYKDQYAAANRSMFTSGLEQAANKDINTDVYGLSHRGANGGRIQDRAIAARKTIDLEQQNKSRAQNAIEAFNAAAPRSGGSNTPAIMGGSTNPYGNASFDTGSLNQGASMGGWERTSGYAEGGAIAVGGRQVLGPGDGKSDSIPAVIDGKRPAALSTGEFVFPVEAVRHFGMDRLNKMVEAARKPQGA
jgi:hypothetical protein